MVVASIRGEPAFGLMVVGLIIVFGPLIAQKLRLPGLVGLLVGGAVIGPNVLGVLESTALLEALGDIGVLYLIFLAGLNLDLKTLRQYRSVTFSFGLITATIPWTLGALVAAADGYDFKTSLLIGSFWASFTLVSYNVIPRYRLERNPAMAATVGASSITDTIGLVALAVIVGSETGDDAAAVLILKIVAGLVAVGIYSFVILPVLTRWFFANLGQERELRFMMVLVGFASAAVVADVVGIEPLIGAFFAGLGLNQLIPNGSQLMARTDFFGNALFIPTFLISVGLLVDPSVMFSGPTVRLALALAAALVVGKGAAALITGRIYSFSRPEVGLMFGLSSAQAAATLASTIIGLEAGFYGDDVVNAVMLVIVISLCVSALGSEYFAPRVERVAADDRRPGEAIVVPVSDANGLRNSIWLAGRITQPDGGVILPLTVAVAEEPDSLERGRQAETQVRQIVRSLGLTGDPELRVERSVAGGVARFSLERDASLVLLTWPGPRNFRSYLLGATHDEIAGAGDHPIAIASLTDTDFARVLVYMPRHDLRPADIVDLEMATGIAVNIASGDHLDVLYGPADRTRLAVSGLAMPESAGHAEGPDELGDWLDETSQPTDLIVVAGGRNPFSLLDRLVQHDRSLLVVANHSDPQSYSTDGALGVANQAR